MSLGEVLFIGIVVVAVVIVAWLLLSGGGSRQSPPAPPAYRPPRPAVQTPVARASTADQQIARARAVFRQRIGTAREAEQERIRQQVLDQERRIAARLARAQREHDFAELKSLHAASRETADLAYGARRSASATVRELSAAITRTHRAIDADRTRGGRQVPALKRTLNVLHEDRNLVNTYCDRYRDDVNRLNDRTGKLRDAINANCGAAGRAWYQALMARTAARREGRSK